MLILHEVDDVDHWLASPKREEVFEPMGITMRTFVDPEKTNRVRLIVDVPNMDVFPAALESEAGAEAMKYDGARPDPIMALVEPSAVGTPALPVGCGRRA